MTTIIAIFLCSSGICNYSLPWDYRISNNPTPATCREYIKPFNAALTDSPGSHWRCMQLNVPTWQALH